MILSPGDVNYAKDHGVAKLGKDVRVFSIIDVNSKITQESTSLQFCYVCCAVAI